MIDNRWLSRARNNGRRNWGSPAAEQRRQARLAALWERFADAGSAGDAMGANLRPVHPVEPNVPFGVRGGGVNAPGFSRYRPSYFAPVSIATGRQREANRQPYLGQSDAAGVIAAEEAKAQAETQQRRAVLARIGSERGRLGIGTFDPADSRLRALEQDLMRNRTNADSAEAELAAIIADVERERAQRSGGGVR